MNKKTTDALLAIRCAAHTLAASRATLHERLELAFAMTLRLVGKAKFPPDIQLSWERLVAGDCLIHEMQRKEAEDKATGFLDLWLEIEIHCRTLKPRKPRKAPPPDPPMLRDWGANP